MEPDVETSPVTKPAPVDRVVLSEISSEVDALLGISLFSDSLTQPLAELQQAMDREALLRLKLSLTVLESCAIQIEPLQQMPVGGRGKSHDSTVNHTIAMLEALQAKLIHDSNSTKRLGKLTLNSRVKELTSKVASALSALFDTLEAMRWDRLEAQADADICSGRVKTFSTGRSAVDYLNSLSKANK